MVSLVSQTIVDIAAVLGSLGVGGSFFYFLYKRRYRILRRCRRGAASATSTEELELGHVRDVPATGGELAAAIQHNSITNAANFPAGDGDVDVPVLEGPIIEGDVGSQTMPSQEGGNGSGGAGGRHSNNSNNSNNPGPQRDGGAPTSGNTTSSPQGTEQHMQNNQNKLQTLSKTQRAAVLLTLQEKLVRLDRQGYIKFNSCTKGKGSSNIDGRRSSGKVQAIQNDRDRYDLDDRGSSEQQPVKRYDRSSTQNRAERDRDRYDIDDRRPSKQQPAGRHNDQRDDQYNSPDDRHASNTRPSNRDRHHDQHYQERSRVAYKHYDD